MNTLLTVVVLLASTITVISTKENDKTKWKPFRDKKPYDRNNLQRAYAATLSGMSVYRAARVYQVPESTLRDRTRQNVSIDCNHGASTLFTEDEERKLVDHIVHMADIGYGYSLMDIQYMAWDYAMSLHKPVKAKEHLSQGWMYSFLSRWDELKVVKPQCLSLSRAKSASKENIDKYFQELNSILTQHDLKQSPQRIFNIDESGFSTEHKPPKIVCGNNTKPQAVTSARTKTVTVIGAANALGNHIPPFYIFPGKRWCDELLEGAAPGSHAGMTESWFVNRDLFKKYLKGNFTNHAGLAKGTDKPTTLILYDGHKSHVSLTLTDWAKEHSVVLFVLPPHSSHLTQPLDIGVFGPMKHHYNNECKAYMHANPGVSITRYEVARLTARPYGRAFSPENITSAFRKAGIYPFNPDVITSTATAPSSIYKHPPEMLRDDADSTSAENSGNKGNASTCKISQNFFEERTITKNVTVKPRKKFTPPYKLQGSLMSDENMEQIKLQHQKKIQIEENAKKKEKMPKSKLPNNQTTCKSPKATTSGLQVNRVNEHGKDAETETDGDDEDQSDLCCVCCRSSPPQLKDIHTLVIIKWGQCDKCQHWVHLTYCCDVRVLRRDSTFLCIHCSDEE